MSTATAVGRCGHPDDLGSATAPSDPHDYAAAVLLDRLSLRADELHALTGWEIKPEGACKGDECVPLAGMATGADGTIDVQAFAERMAMPLVGDEKHGIWALGPRAAGHVLESVELPDLVLSDFDGNAFQVTTLRGRKVLLLAWASW
jgi:hypothetical protein